MAGATGLGVGQHDESSPYDLRICVLYAICPDSRRYDASQFSVLQGQEAISSFLAGGISGSLRGLDKHYNRAFHQPKWIILRYLGKGFQNSFDALGDHGHAFRTSTNHLAGLGHCVLGGYLRHKRGDMDCCNGGIEPSLGTTRQFYRRK